jgi:K+-transporting ATPase ATPase C chain
MEESPMQEIKPALLMLILFTVICGGIYPVAVTGLAKALFPRQAEGSFITDPTGKVTGSALIGQPFSDPKYLWPRPSATSDFAYNPMASGGSNAGPTNPAYLKTVAERLAGLRAAGVSGPVAADLVQASASGLDPHVSPQAASVQVRRVAQARGLSEERVARIIAEHLEDRQFGFMGAPRINVLAVNLELDALAP